MIWMNTAGMCFCFLCRRGHLVSDMGSSGERCESDPPRAESDSHSPYHWTRQLVKAEERDPYRYMPLRCLY